MNHASLELRSWSPSGPDDRKLAIDELEKVLNSTPFRNSRRYPAMLRYIVEKTLDGQEHTLKERTIGIEVFGRTPDYDTNADPVVRFSAGEIRRRLALYYQENEDRCTILFELPSGSYIPKIYSRVEPSSAVLSTPATLSSTASQQRTRHAEPTPEPAPRSRSRWTLYALLCLVFLGLGLALVLSLTRNKAQNSMALTQNPVMEVWGPLLSNPSSVVISAGQPMPKTAFLGHGAHLPSSDITIGDYILRPQFRVSVSTLNAIANIVGNLKLWNKPFQIQAANINSLADFHDRPVVLVDGNDNRWTLLLLGNLRFHLIQKGDFSYIEDTENPEFRGWSIDFSKPFLKQTTDYAIVGRFFSPTTGGPVIVIAGISMNGTEAAGEFIVSPTALASLQKLAPPGGLKKNFEAVLKVQVIDGNTGAATVVAAQFW